MFKTQKTRIAAWLLGAAAALAAAPSFAWHGGCMGPGPMGGPMAGKATDGRFAERMKMHQQRLHAALKLTPKQEGAWAKFQESHPCNKAGQPPASPDFAKLTAPERAEKMLEWQKQHQDAMSQHVNALKDFYGQLTPEQQKTFDSHTLQGRRGTRGPGPGGGTGRGPGPGAGAGPAPAPSN